MLKSHKAFTLLELIIVLAVIGIIAAFAVPSIIEYGKHQKEQEKSSAERAINKVLNQCYALEARYPAGGNIDLDGNGKPDWMDYLTRNYQAVFYDEYIYTYDDHTGAVVLDWGP